MGLEAVPQPGVYAGRLADHARMLQREARCALDQGHYTRASALLGDAEMLADDVHQLVGEMERRELSGLAMLAAYDVRDAALPSLPRKRSPFVLPSRGMRIMIGASLAIGLAMTE